VKKREVRFVFENVGGKASTIQRIAITWPPVNGALRGDGCNTCKCLGDLSVACTKIACSGLAQS